MWFEHVGIPQQQGIQGLLLLRGQDHIILPMDPILLALLERHRSDDRHEDAWVPLLEAIEHVQTGAGLKGGRSLKNESLPFQLARDPGPIP